MHEFLYIKLQEQPTCEVANHAVGEANGLKLHSMNPLIDAKETALGFDNFRLNCSVC